MPKDRQDHSNKPAAHLLPTERERELRQKGSDALPRGVEGRAVLYKYI